MRILIDIGHPAHVHLFKHFAQFMLLNGHEILFTLRDKENEAYLMSKFNLPFKNLGRHFISKKGKLIGLIKFSYLVYKTALKFKPDYSLSHGSIYAALASRLINKPHISLEDTFNFEQIRLYKPFTKVILTSGYSHPDLGINNIDYNSYHELAYLHQNYFSPNRGNKYKTDSVRILLRFVAWEATHDAKSKGISLEMKRKAIEEFKKFGEGIYFIGKAFTC